MIGFVILLETSLWTRNIKWFYQFNKLRYSSVDCFCFILRTGSTFNLDARVNCTVNIQDYVSTGSTFNLDARVNCTVYIQDYVSTGSTFNLDAKVNCTVYIQDYVWQNWVGRQMNKSLIVKFMCPPPKKKK